MTFFSFAMRRAASIFARHSGSAQRALAAALFLAIASGERAFSLFARRASIAAAVRVFFLPRRPISFFSRPSGLAHASATAADDAALRLACTSGFCASRRDAAAILARASSGITKPLGPSPPSVILVSLTPTRRRHLIMPISSSDANSGAEHSSRPISMFSTPCFSSTNRWCRLRAGRGRYRCLRPFPT